MKRVLIPPCTSRSREFIYSRWMDFSLFTSWDTLELWIIFASRQRFSSPPPSIYSITAIWRIALAENSNLPDRPLLLRVFRMPDRILYFSPLFPSPISIISIPRKFQVRGFLNSFRITFFFFFFERTQDKIYPVKNILRLNIYIYKSIKINAMDNWKFNYTGINRPVSLPFHVGQMDNELNNCLNTTLLSTYSDRTSCTKQTSHSTYNISSNILTP